MDKMSISFIISGVFIVVFWILTTYFKKQQFRKVGKILTIIHLEGKKIKTTYRMIVSLSFALFMFGIFIIFLHDEGNLMPIILQASVIGIISFFSGSYNRIYFGENGFSGAGYSFKKISDIKEVHWDKDISQLLWGLKIYINSKSKPFRLYIPREHKEEIENYFTEKLI